MLALSYNNWDDYDIKSTLNAVLYIENDEIIRFSLKLMIEGIKDSPKFLNSLRVEEKWNGFFPIPNVNYVSVPSDIDLYSILLNKLGKQSAEDVLKNIRDAGYLLNVVQDNSSDELIHNLDFKTSLLREAGAKKAFNDGWRLFTDSESSINDFDLNIIQKDNSTESIKFKFNSKYLPYDINILIGPNGVGKSYTLKSLVEYWLGVDSGNKLALDKINHIPFNNHPNIAKLILISYSPFEDFTIDLKDAELIDKEAYKYFGFRQIAASESGDKRITISRNLPSRDAVSSIIKAVTDDIKFDFMSSWINKYKTIESVLIPAVGFDSIACEMASKEFVTDGGPPFNNSLLIEDIPYLLINRETINNFSRYELEISDFIKPTSGVTFLKDNKPINLSSGQRLFCFIVINVVGEIRKDSLVVIDEPELFLHPQLEIQFISLLKNVLSAFSSKAILATHSEVIAREIPSKCIHVYHPDEEQVLIQNPPFETFGGDLQRISSYVFGDSHVSKPFDAWITENIDRFPSKEAFIEEIGAELNEEMLMKILNYQDKNGLPS